MSQPPKPPLPPFCPHLHSKKAYNSFLQLQMSWPHSPSIWSLAENTCPTFFYPPSPLPQHTFLSNYPHLHSQSSRKFHTLTSFFHFWPAEHQKAYKAFA